MSVLLKANPIEIYDGTTLKSSIGIFTENKVLPYKSRYGNIETITTNQINFTNTGNSKYKCIIVETNPGDSIYIVSGSNFPSFAWLKSYNDSDTSPNLSDIDNGVYSQNSNTSARHITPSDAHYFCVNIFKDDVPVFPKLLTINGAEINLNNNELFYNIYETIKASEQWDNATTITPTSYIELDSSSRVYNKGVFRKTALLRATFALKTAYTAGDFLPLFNIPSKFRPGQKVPFLLYNENNYKCLTAVLHPDGNACLVNSFSQAVPIMLYAEFEYTIG